MLKVIKRSIPAVAILTVVILGAVCDYASAVQKKTDFMVRVGDSMSLIIPRNDIYLPLNPESDEIVYEDVPVEVRTNNKNGASVYLTTNKGSVDNNGNNAPQDSVTSLVGRNTKMAIRAIPYVSSIEASRFPNGAWGYSVDGGNIYYPVVAKNQSASPNAKILETGSSGETGASIVRIGAKADKKLLSDYYENTIIFTAVSNPTPKTIADIIYMQEVDEDVIDSMSYGAQVQLADARDNKMYWVSKLQDGNLWMTQNLDLTLASNITLTPEDTDIKANWTPINSTIEAREVSQDSWVNNGMTPRSYGVIDDNYYTTASGYINDNITPEIVDGRYAFRANTYTDAESCRAAVYDEDYCDHYNVGKYYNWAAAIAMNDITALADDGETKTVDQSICPAGWRLPIGSTAYYGKGEYARLLEVSEIADPQLLSSGKTVSSYLVDKNYDDLMNDPLFLTNAGAKSSNKDKIVHDEGAYWTSTAHNYPNVDRLQFGTASNSSQIINTNYYPDTNNAYEDLGIGRSIRCLYRPTHNHNLTYKFNGTITTKEFSNSVANSSIKFTPEKDLGLPENEDIIIGKQYVTNWCYSSQGEYFDVNDYNDCSSLSYWDTVRSGETIIAESDNRTTYIYPSYGEGSRLDFYSNGGTFDNGTTDNPIIFGGRGRITTSSKNSSGVRKTSINDNTNYGNYQNYTDTFYFNSSRTTTVTIKYGTESCCDYVCINPSYSSSTCYYKFNGSGTRTLYIQASNIKVRFYSDGSVTGYGYWIEFTTDVPGVDLKAGKYRIPTREGHTFLGWSTDPAATTPDWTWDPENGTYSDGDAVYAVWD